VSNKESVVLRQKEKIKKFSTLFPDGKKKIMINLSVEEELKGVEIYN